MDTNETCKDRIHERYDDRIGAILHNPMDATLDEMLEKSRYFGYSMPDRESEETDDEYRERIADDVAEMHRESVCEMPLCISTEYVRKIELSTGGPADWIELVSDGHEWIRGSYHFADWYDHAEESIPCDDVDLIADVFGLDPNPAEWGG